jgi:protein-L-isoaspartate(D-aspartate) O-methyltransferase
MTARLRMRPEVVGMGMTSQRVRDRLIERLRAGSGGSDGIRDERVLNAIRTVPRHLFVDEALATRAYEDTALPIGHGQTISQPWVVARMTEALFSDRTPADGMAADAASPRKVLEIGTGSGYQATILAALGLQVYTVERIGELLRIARKRFRALGLDIRSKHDDGRIGWPEHGPYDGILVTAGAPALVDALTAQLAPGGVLVAPVGAGSAQSLMRLRKAADGGIEQSELASVVFVPLLSGLVD